MNILTTPYRRSQLIALPMPGGKAKVEYCYAVNIPGDRTVVSHDFAEWAVGDWRREVEADLCVNLTGNTLITTESACMSSAMTATNGRSSSCETAIPMNACSHLSSSGRNLSGWADE